MIKTLASDFSFQSHYVDIFDSSLHFIDEGEGDPILFLHGVPASSYVWRNVIPCLTSLGRCIAPDLIGMGKSAKPDIAYSVFDHIKYIDQFIKTLDLKNLTLVMHGWGSVIGFDYAMRNEKNCKGLVFYEAFFRSLINDQDIALPLEQQLHRLEEKKGYDLILQDGTYYIDSMLPQEMLRHLSQEEKKHYREPFLEKGSGKPIQQYLKELPRAGQKNEIINLIERYSKKLTESQLPKLMLYSVPGFITTIATAIWAKENLPNLEMVDVGEELHYAQESHPTLMGETISVWLQGIEQQK